MLSVLTHDNRRLLVDKGGSYLVTDNDYFVAHVGLSKDEFCEKCLGKMNKVSESLVTRSGPVEGKGLKKYYECSSCGHKYEKYCLD